MYGGPPVHPPPPRTNPHQLFWVPFKVLKHIWDVNSEKNPMLLRYPRWRPKWPPKMVKILKSHISAKKYDKNINTIVRYMFLTLTKSFMVLLFCYYSLNSRWRPRWPPKWPPKVVKFEKKSYISQNI